MTPKLKIKVREEFPGVGPEARRQRDELDRLARILDEAGYAPTRDQVRRLDAHCVYPRDDAAVLGVMAAFFEPAGPAMRRVALRFPPSVEREGELVDARHLVAVFAARGYAIGLAEAVSLWERRSLDMDANWDGMDKSGRSDDAIFHSLQDYFGPGARLLEDGDDDR